MADPEPLDRLKAENERERLAIDRKRLAIDEQRLETERQRLAIEKARAAIEQANVRVEENRTSIERYKAHVAAHTPSLEAVIKFADVSIRSLLILNGGAALAFLTFAANRGGSFAPYPANVLASIVGAFGIGAALSVATAGFAYLSQLFSAGATALGDEEIAEKDRLTWWARNLLITACVLFVLGLICFLRGMYWAASQIRNLPADVSLFGYS